MIFLDLSFILVLLQCSQNVYGKEKNIYESESGEGYLSMFAGAPLKKPFAKIAQGIYILFYIPEMAHCDYATFERYDNERMYWTEMVCGETPSTGWIWTYPAEPAKENVYRVTSKMGGKPILNGKIYSLPELPPPINSVRFEVGAGWVYAWVRLPREKVENLLGIRVTFTDQDWNKDEAKRFSGWVTVYFDRAIYSGSTAMLWPVHHCPQWPKSNWFCMLFTDKMQWSNKYMLGLARLPVNYSLPGSTRPVFVTRDKTMMQFRFETFRIPYPHDKRLYSTMVEKSVGHTDCYPYDMAVDDITKFKCPYGMTGIINLGNNIVGEDAKKEDAMDDIAMNMIFDEFSGSDLPPPERQSWPREDQLWLIFICATLLILIVLLPVFYYFAKRAGRRYVVFLWRKWAEAPGNITLGLGYTATGMEGRPPRWTYEPGGKGD